MLGSYDVEQVENVTTAQHYMLRPFLDLSYQILQLSHTFICRQNYEVAVLPNIIKWE